MSNYFCDCVRKIYTILENHVEKDKKKMYYYMAKRGKTHF